MKSVKPGRGPSFMGGIIGIFVALFGVVWTILAVSSGAGFMGVFGLIFVVIAVIQTVYNFKNATSENRYSEFDITDDGEEIDPWNERFGVKKEVNRELKSQGSGYCPYCGARADEDYSFCRSCGKKLP